MYFSVELVEIFTYSYTINESVLGTVQK